jgi:diguanylate cyclase (GGDEF)-like protein
METIAQYLARQGGAQPAGGGHGATPLSDWLASQPPQDRGAEPPIQDEPRETLLDTGVTMGLRVVPAVLGGLGAGALAIESGPGAIVAGAAGGAAGAGLGETAAEAYEKWRGYRKNLNPVQIATQTAIGAIPIPGSGAGVKGLLSAGAKGFGLGAGATAATELAEGQTPDVGSVVKGGLVGTVFGAGAHGAMRYLQGRAGRAVVPGGPPATLVEPYVDAFGKPAPGQVAQESTLADVLRGAASPEDVAAVPQFTRESGGTQPVPVGIRRPDLVAARAAERAAEDVPVVPQRGSIAEYLARDQAIQAETAAGRPAEDAAVAARAASEAAQREAGAAESFRGTPAAETTLAGELQTPERLAALRARLGMPAAAQTPEFARYAEADQAAKAAAESEWPAKMAAGQEADQAAAAAREAEAARAFTGVPAAETTLAAGLQEEANRPARLAELRNALGLGQAKPNAGFQRVQDVSAEMRGAPTGRVLANLTPADRALITRMRQSISTEMPSMFGLKNGNSEFYDRVRAVGGRPSWSNADIRSGIDRLADGIDNSVGQAALRAGREHFPETTMSPGFRNYVEKDQAVQGEVASERSALDRFLAPEEPPAPPAEIPPHIQAMQDERRVAGPFSGYGQAVKAAEELTAQGRPATVRSLDAHWHEVVEPIPAAERAAAKAAAEPDVYTGRVPGEDDVPEGPLDRLKGLLSEGKVTTPQRAFKDLVADPFVDDLTGLPNRPGLERATERRALGAGEASHAMIDLDNFKAVNDTLGHAAGDEALRTAAGAIRGVLRKGDVLGRWGGDEFALHVKLEGAGGKDLGALQAKIEGAVSDALEQKGLRQVGGREVGASVAFGDTPEAADAALKLRKAERGVSQPRGRTFLGDESGFATAGMARGMGTVGGGVVGGAIGATQGDTPEERMKNAALGAMLGAGTMYAGGRLAAKAGQRGESALGKLLEPTNAEAAAAGRTAKARAGVGVEARRQFGLTDTAAELARRELPSARSIPTAQALDARLDKFPEEIRGDLQRVLDSPTDPRQGPGFAAQRRQVIPDARAQALADLVRVDVTKPGPVGQAMTEEEIIAHRNVLAALSIKTADKAKVLQQAGIDVTKRIDVGGMSDVQTTQLLDWAETNAAREVVYQRLMGGRAEAGRSLRAFRMMARTAPGDIQVIRDVLRKGHFDQDLLKLANVWGSIDTTDPAAVYRAMKDVQTRKLSDSVTGYWMSNVLSGIKTQERNTFGNLTRLATGIVTKGVATGPLDALKSALTGSERTVFASEAVHDLAGAMHSAGRAWNDFWYTLKNGFSEEWLNSSLDLEGGFTPRSEFRGIGLPGSIGGHSLAIPVPEGLNPGNWPGRLLEAMDRGFYQLNSGAERYSQSYTQARREAMRLKLAGGAFDNFVSNRMVDLRENMPLAMQKSVHEQALEATYRENEGAFGQVLQKMKREVPGMTFVMPFVKTVSNIFRQGYEYTPISGAVKLGKQLAGNPQAWNRAGGGAREATMMQGKAALGTAASAFFAYLAAQGRLSGSGPVDRATRAQLMATGWRPNSVKMDLPDGVGSVLGATKSDDGQYWVNYSLFQPLSIPMSLVANAYESWQDVAHSQVKHSKAQDVSTLAAQTISRVAKSALNQSYLQGLFTFADAINNGQLSAEKFLEQIVQGFVPGSGMLRNVTQAVDPTIRDPNGIAEAVKANIPGLSQTVSAKLGRYGEPIERSGNQLRRFLGVPEVEPTTSDWVDKELNRIGVDIGTPSDRLTLQEWMPNADKQMTEQQSVDIRQARGRMTRARIALLMAAPGYEQLPDEIRAQLVRQVVSGGASMVAAGGRASMMLQRPELLQSLMVPMNEIAARSYAPGQRKGT